MLEFFFDQAFVVFLLSAVSLLAGFIDSIAGGGGLLVLPALLMAGIPPQPALGTAKLASNLGTMVAAYNFYKNKSIVWKLVGYGIVFTLIGSYIGAKSVLFLSEKLVADIIIVVLPVALAMSFIPKKKSQLNRENWSKPVLYLGVPIACFCLGFYDGFLGPGAGTLLILVFHILFGVSLTMASGTSKIFNLTSNMGATITFMALGKCVYIFGIPMSVTYILGSHIGSKLVIKKGDGVVKYTLLVSVMLLIASLAYKFLIHGQ